MLWREGQGEWELKQKRLNSFSPGREHRAGHLKPAVKGAVGQVEVSGGLCCESGCCDPLAGVAGVYGSSAFSIGSTSRMQTQKNWQEECAGGKAKKSHPPRSCAPWAKCQNCPGGSGSPSSSALLHEIDSHLATACIPLVRAVRSCVLSYGRGEDWRGERQFMRGGRLRLAPSCGRYWNRTVKVTTYLPKYVTGTRLAKGTHIAAEDLEPLCKFTRGYGKANMLEPSKSCAG